MKEGESIWHYLSPGLGEFTLPKRAFWYEIIPGIAAFKAVWLGKTRKTLFGKKQYLILYRDVNNVCTTGWALSSELVERNDYYIPPRRKNVCRDKELNELFNNILKEAKL